MKGKAPIFVSTIYGARTSGGRKQQSLCGIKPPLYTLRFSRILPQCDPLEETTHLSQVLGVLQLPEVYISNISKDFYTHSLHWLCFRFRWIFLGSTHLARRYRQPWHMFKWVQPSLGEPKTSTPSIWDLTTSPGHKNASSEAGPSRQFQLAPVQPLTAKGAAFQLQRRRGIHDRSLWQWEDKGMIWTGEWLVKQWFATATAG